jgi:hypothetical protein
MAELSLTLDLMGKCFKTLLYWNHLENWSQIFRNVHLMGLYKFSFFYVDRNSKMTTTAGHSFYIGPIGSFYNQVNDTGSWEPLVQLYHNQNMYHFDEMILFEGISHVIDASKYLTPSNQKRCYTNICIRILFLQVVICILKVDDNTF